MISPDAARALEQTQTPLDELMAEAARLRDQGHGSLVSYSRKLFLPLTHLCRDVCRYCTFAQSPRAGEAAYLSIDSILKTARDGVALGCKEALFTLGDKPELRWPAAREALDRLGHETTLSYLSEVARIVFDETGLLPHINAGVLSPDDLTDLRGAAPSMGLMLESTSSRLLERGGPHHGCPDKDPSVRLKTMEDAGRLRIPFTSGLLIGIGETRLERIETLLALRDLHDRHGHIQEIIIQPFRAKPGTPMAAAPEPSLDDLLWTIAIARLIFGPDMAIQSPPNLAPDAFTALIRAGINDWGGVSPLTPDFVNPEAPWPHLDALSDRTAAAGKVLTERLTIYPRYALETDLWVDKNLTTAVRRAIDARGLARTDDWLPGRSGALPPSLQDAVKALPVLRTAALDGILNRAENGTRLDEKDIVRLFDGHGPELAAIVQAADELRRKTAGEAISYVVTRNINYTNICTYGCRFCAFSKGKTDPGLRGRPYDITAEEITRRVREAWDRGATEVCLQGGIHPDYTGQTYLDILHTAKTACPDMHVHAFSPLEVWHGSTTLGVTLDTYFGMLKDAGLGSIPGTAAEILDDEVRAVLCPDKITTAQWLEVMAAAHRNGVPSTATIMFGHVDRPIHWARHLLRLRDLQAETGGFTELVPLPFVAAEAPIYRHGQSRSGPTARECLLMHAVARLVLHPLIANIQTSWVKMGLEGAGLCLNAGANDLGGTLMNESITRAAGATHGQEMRADDMDRTIARLGRTAWQRTTLYKTAHADRRKAALAAPQLAQVDNAPYRPKRPVSAA